MMIMTHTYKVSGMTCTGCQAKVQSLLTKVKSVSNVEIDLAKGEAHFDGNLDLEAARKALSAKKFTLVD